MSVSDSDPESDREPRPLKAWPSMSLAGSEADSSSIAVAAESPLLPDGSGLGEGVEGVAVALAVELASGVRADDVAFDPAWAACLAKNLFLAPPKMRSTVAVAVSDTFSDDFEGVGCDFFLDWVGGPTLTSESTLGGDFFLPIKKVKY